MFDLSGKTALVTGASGGIGGAVARVLHGQGATLVLTDMRPEGAEALKAELGSRVHVVIGNLTETGAADTVAKAAEAAAGQVDILVNNAGITRDDFMMRMKDEAWDLVIAINLTAAFRLSRAVLRGMLKKRWGRIVSIASVVGAAGNPGQANYAASKAGLVGMTKALAGEVATRNITVNCVAPGFIKTPMTDALNDEQKKALSGRIPMGRLGMPDDVAACVLFLASDEAAYITGQTLHTNGGLAMI